MEPLIPTSSITRRITRPLTGACAAFLLIVGVVAVSRSEQVRQPLQAQVLSDGTLPPHEIDRGDLARVDPLEELIAGPATRSPRARTASFRASNPERAPVAHGVPRVTRDPRSALLPITSTNIQWLANVPLRGGAVVGVAGGRFARMRTTTGLKTLFFVTGATTGLTVVDATSPRLPVVIGELPLPHWENEDVDLAGNTLLISVDGANGSAVFVIDISDPHAPRVRGAYKFGDEPGKWNAMDGDGPGHIANCIAECRYAWVTGASGGHMAVLDLGDSSQATVEPRLVAVIHPEAGDPNKAFRTGSVHDVNVDPTGLVWVTGSGGVSAYGVGGRWGGSPVAPKKIAAHPASDRNTFILHNSLRPGGGEILYVTEENWLQYRNDCANQGRFQTWRFDGASLTPLDTWKLDVTNGIFSNGSGPQAWLCSSHWFDYAEGLVAVGWYQQGMRLLDVSDPTTIRQAGWFINPDAIASAGYFHPDDPSITYVADYQRGVDVLKLCSQDCPLFTSASARQRYLDVQAPTVTFAPSPTWGLACPRFQ